jgi:hypothetical protein
MALMKLLPTAYLLALVFLVPDLVRAQSAQQILSDAQTAYIRGDMESAKKGFEMVYRMDPRNAVAIGYLRMIKVAEAKAPKGNDLEKQLEGVIIPKVEFREATLTSGLDYLRQAIGKVTDGKVPVNFVVNLPEEQKNYPVTLSLTNVPFTDVLRYVGGLANVKFSYDKYAISVQSAGAPPPAPVSAPPATQSTTPAIPGLNP